MSDEYTPQPYDLGRPPHLLANDVLRRISHRNFIEFGPDSRADMEQLIHQYREELLNDSTQIARLMLERDRLREALEEIAADAPDVSDYDDIWFGWHEAGDLARRALKGE